MPPPEIRIRFRPANIRWLSAATRAEMGQCGWRALPPKLPLRFAAAFTTAYWRRREYIRRAAFTAPFDAGRSLRDG